MSSMAIRFSPDDGSAGVLLSLSPNAAVAPQDTTGLRAEAAISGWIERMLGRLGFITGQAPRTYVQPQGSGYRPDGLRGIRPTALGLQPDDRRET